MREFDYHQRPSTPEYRENWARIFQVPRTEVNASVEKPGRPTPVVERPGAKSVYLFGAFSRECPACGAHAGFSCRDDAGFPKVLVHPQRRAR